MTTLKIKGGKDNYSLAKKSKKKRWLCPICFEIKSIDSKPAVSRQDNNTEICSDCGTAEALENFAKAGC